MIFTKFPSFFILCCIHMVVKRCFIYRFVLTYLHFFLCVCSFLFCSLTRMRIGYLFRWHGHVYAEEFHEKNTLFFKIHEIWNWDWWHIAVTEKRYHKFMICNVIYTWFNIFRMREKKIWILLTAFTLNIRPSYKR